MPYELGVDLGTTFTAAAVREVGGEPVMVGLGNRALQVPSVLFRTDSGFVVGEGAERRGAAEPRRLVREFKRRLGDPVSIYVDGAPFSAETLSATLLRWVVDAVARRQGEPPAGLVLTHPASWSEFKLDVLRQVVTLAEVGPVRWCSEPVAAAAQYASRARVAVGDRLAVYDLGGGTFDACVLEQTATGFEMLGPAEGVEHLGGVDFDEAVFEQVRTVLGARLASLDTDDPATTVALARLRRECVEAKEALSVDAETTVPVALPGLMTSVRVTRTELEQLIASAVGETMAALTRAIRAARIEPRDLSAVVLVGGSSRIPLVGEVLQQTFGVPAALDTHPKHDVVLGSLRTGPPPEPAKGQGRRRRGARAAAATGAGAAVGAAGAAATAAGRGTAGVPASGSSTTTGGWSWGESAGSGAASAGPATGGRSSGADAFGVAGEGRGPTAGAGAPGPVGPGGPGGPRGPGGPVRGGPGGPARPGGPAGPDAAYGALAPGGGGPEDPEAASRRRRLLVVGGAVAAVVVLGVAAAVVGPRLVGGAGGTAVPSPSPSAPASTPAPPSPTATPSATPTPSAPAVDLPRSAPLPPDQLMFGMEDDKNVDLYLASTQSPAPVRRLTTRKTTDRSPALSPDLRTVVYVNVDDEDADGEGPRTLRVAGAADGSGDRLLLDALPKPCRGSVSRPAWDPADPSVLVLPCVDSKGRDGLYRVRTDGTVLNKVVQPGPEIGDPTFSPDGSRLAFWSGPKSRFDGGTLYVTTGDGLGTPQRLLATTMEAQDADPTFSPDGSTIAFRRRDPDGTRGGEFNVYTMPADGSGKPKRLVGAPGSDEENPVFSPTGDQVAYKSDAPVSSSDKDPVARVWVVGSDGTDPHVLLTKRAPGEQTAPTWGAR